MSNLSGRTGQSPDFDPRSVQTVRVREIDTTEIGNSDDEIDLRDLCELFNVARGSVA